jgi:hypothetical protein
MATQQRSRRLSSNTRSKALLRWIDSDGRVCAHDWAKLQDRREWYDDEDGFSGEGIVRAGVQWLHFRFSHLEDGRRLEFSHGPITESEAWLFVTTIFEPDRWPLRIQRHDAAVRRDALLKRLPPPICAQWPARHGDDFRSTHWFGRSHSFTDSQAEVVKYLWEHCLRGTPEVGIRQIRAGTGLDFCRLSDVFQKNGASHLAWGTMIGPGNTKGTVRLILPPGEPETSLQPILPQNTTLRTVTH